MSRPRNNRKEFLAGTELAGNWWPVDWSWLETQRETRCTQWEIKRQLTWTTSIQTDTNSRLASNWQASYEVRGDNFCHHLSPPSLWPGWSYPACYIVHHSPGLRAPTVRYADCIEHTTPVYLHCLNNITTTWWLHLTANINIYNDGCETVKLSHRSG